MSLEDMALFYRTKHAPILMSIRVYFERMDMIGQT